VDDLLAQPVSEGRSLVAAIGATESGDLCIAAGSQDEVIKINRGRLSPGADPRLLSALDTIEVSGRVLRVTEREQKFLVCDNCGMLNPYAHTDNCTHCGTRLINSVTRIVQ
jgi:ribosomal protein L40E